MGIRDSLVIEQDPRAGDDGLRAVALFEGVGESDGVAVLVQAREVGRVVSLAGRDRERRQPVSYTHLRAHETVLDIVCRLLLAQNHETSHLDSVQSQLSHTQ